MKRALLAHLMIVVLLLAVARSARTQPPPINIDVPIPKSDDKGQEKATSEKGEKEKASDEPVLPSWLSIHGQGTIVSQGNWKFRSPYEGENSLLPILNYRTTETATLFLAARVWQGGEIVFNPEVAGGVGLSNTLGMAGFPNGEATRVGAIAPSPYVARALFRQTFNLDGDNDKVEDGPNAIAGFRDMNRVTVSVGKMSASDQFDNNAYSHDPRTQLLNWSLMNNGAWDYPANARGYTYGVTADFNTRFLALRYGVFAEPSTANGREFDPHVLNANGHILEAELRYDLADRPGRLRLAAYLNHAHMGNYREALAAMPVDPDISQTHTYRLKYGFLLNAEQELSRDLGAFLRLGWNDGQSETWAFTEIDATASLGLLLKGTAWRRPNDSVGLGLVVNGLSDAHRDYLAAGGLGFIIGDGRLRYGPEEILETYYNWQLKKGINAALDLQGVNNPAYNRDRGPVAILGVRVHFEY